jgi:spore maturation protein CgeB
LANIVITHFAGIVSKGVYKSACFHDGLVQGFIDHGHNVLQVLTPNFILTPWNGTNKAISASAKKEALEKIKNFKPDLVISFNNSSIEDLEKEVDCPIVLWDADTFPFFNDKEKIKKNADRYHYVSFANSGIAEYKKYLKISEKNICRISGATGVKAQKIEKKYNISFIGNPFFPRDIVTRMMLDNPEFLKAPKSFFLKDELLWREFFKKSGISLEEILFFDAGDRRIKLITHLFDLGIHIFGPTDWLRLSSYLIDIINSYDSATVFSLKHNELIYNRSKISVNICHSQNVSGYPWRIPDILASDAVLLSDHKVDLVHDFGKVVPLQLYHSPTEAYEISKRLLNDSQLRQDIVEQQNACIEKNFRWHHRFPLLQQLTGVNLERTTFTPGSYENLSPIISMTSKSIGLGTILLSKLKNHKPRPSIKNKLYKCLPEKIRRILYIIYVNSKNRPGYE